MTKTKNAASRAAQSVSAANDNSQEFNSANWRTPFWVIELTRATFTGGQIDLDPCSCAAANETIGASVFYDEKHDGLSENWAPRTFVNPPGHGGKRYPRDTSPVAKFWLHLARQYSAGIVHEFVWLAFDMGQLRTLQGIESRNGESLMRECLICIPRKRIAFLDHENKPQNGNRYDSAILYAGKNRHTFRALFGTKGLVIG